ncbi:hypothetical protein PAECIP111892_03994 [Paenibacillus auburnensis]|uniref:Sigma-70 family RNA polymerase sigma factor n=1 Tax=Paenibacillus auburnensis TaxID=2905649 RepID=A0ABM9CKA3_9BACL|nr:hypothetical protein [Paenibacillus auburnensis]CAH1214247.1 hypothetical protein PAECIP111892_03994 [Paenibacillus auburnensis]
MPDLLSPQPAAAAGFEQYIREYSGGVLALSSILLGKGSEAERVTAGTFNKLYVLYCKGKLKAADFSVEAYRECILQCTKSAKSRNLRTSKELSWDDQLVKALWYGLLLPLPEIGTILGKSLPALKAQLRRVREHTAGLKPLRSQANLSIV